MINRGVSQGQSQAWAARTGRCEQWQPLDAVGYGGDGAFTLRRGFVMLRAHRASSSADPSV